MKLSLAFSPCPNDTFIFYAMVHQKIDTEGLVFKPILADVAELNQKAFQATYDITKLSYHAFAYMVNNYALLEAGSALGQNCGPILIAKNELDISVLQNAKIAIPGKYTTANFLFRLAYPSLPEGQEMLFSDIESAILNDEVDAGLIIHENRFTYEEKGLIKIRDMGEYWEDTYNLPIPLGGIVVSRKLPIDIQQKVNRVLKRSIAFAFEHPEATMNYVGQYAQEMDKQVMQQHINLYVNKYTLDLGQTGKTAIETLFKVAVKQGLIQQLSDKIFI